MNMKKILASLLAVAAACTMSIAASALSVDAPEAEETEIEVVAEEETGATERAAFVATILRDNKYVSMHTTVNEAIQKAVDGDTVLLAAGEHPAIDISNKNITLCGYVKDGECFTSIKGGITAHGFNGTIKDIKIVDAFKAFYAEPAGNIIFDNIYVTGATYGIHAVAYSTGLTWTIKNSYMDLSWANSFGAAYGGDAEIIVKNNTFESTSPYYSDYGALFVNTFLPKVTIEENIFGENAKIYIDKSVADTSNINIGNNYYEDGAANVFADDSDGVKVPIYTEYKTSDKEDVVYNLADVKAVINDKCYSTLKAAINDAVEGNIIYLYGTIEEGSINLPATITNLTIDGQGSAIVKNTTFNAANGNTSVIVGLTVKNTTFENSRFNLGGNRNGEVLYKDITFTNNKFLNIEAANNMAAVHMQVDADEKIENFTFTKNVINGVSGSSNSGLVIKQVYGDIVIDNNTITNVAWNAIQVMFSHNANIAITNNTLSSGAEEGVVNLNGVTKVTYSDNKVTLGEGQSEIGYFALAAKIGNVYYPSLEAAINAANEGDVIVLTQPTYEAPIAITKSVVITGNPTYGPGASLTGEFVKPVIVIKDVTNGGVKYQAPGIVFDNLVFEVAEDATGSTWNVSALGFYYEDVKNREGLTVTNCDFINNSEIAMSAIAANLASYTISDNTFKNFTTMVHSYVDHGALGNVVISNNTFTNVDNIANVYWGVEGTAPVIAITNNTSTDGSVAKIAITDFGKTKATPVTAIPKATVSGNTAELEFGNLDKSNTLTTDIPTVYNYANIDVIKALDGKLPDGTIYTNYGTPDQQMYIVENGKYKVEAKNVSIVFEENTYDADGQFANELDNSVYDIYLVANEGGILHRLNSADFTFELTTDGKDDMAYEILATNSEIAINNVNNDANRYEFHYDGKTGTITDTATKIKIGTVKFTGFGGYTFAVDTTEVAENTNQVHTTTFVDNIVDSFAVIGEVSSVDADGDLVVNGSMGGIIENTIIVPTKTLTINIDFPNSVENSEVAYQQMKVVVYGGELEAPLTIKLGNNSEISGFGMYDNKTGIEVEVTDLYTITVKNLLEINTAYTVEVSGEGYRTARYTVTMTDDKTLNFWNNVKDNAIAIEEGKNKMTSNFLAGDIVKDNNINIYDLSAVVSYFGEINLKTTAGAEKYAKYDLNRDGKIDSKDVAYVLVSWNN